MTEYTADEFQRQRVIMLQVEGDYPDPFPVSELLEGDEPDAVRASVKELVAVGLLQELEQSGRVAMTDAAAHYAELVSEGQKSRRDDPPPPWE